MSPNPERRDRVDRENVLLERIADLEEKLDRVLTRSEQAMGILVRVSKLLIPPIVVGFMLVITLIAYPDRFGDMLGRFVGGIFVGKIFAAGLSENLLFWLIVLGTLDVMIGLFFIWNVDVVYKLPWAGDKFRKMEGLSSYFLIEHGWMRRAAFMGVTLWIFLPLYGTGAITGSVLGRLLGLGTWRTFLALVIAGYSGVTLVLSGTALAEQLRDIDPVLMGLFVVLVVVALVGLWWRYVYQVQLRKRAQAVAGGDPDEPLEG